MRLRTLVVDDEPLARAKVARMLAAHPDIDLVGEATSGEEAMAAIARLRPDLLYDPVANRAKRRSTARFRRLPKARQR